MQPDVLTYSKLLKRILKVFSLTAQQRLDRLLSLPVQLEQQYDVSLSQVWHEITSLMTLPDGKKINYGHELWRRCVPLAVRANTTSSMADSTENQLDQVDQHAAILDTNPTIAAVSSSSVRRPSTSPATC